MKLMMLFEIDEKLDRSQYGEWIAPDNTVHPLRGLEHAKWYVIYVLKKRAQDIDSWIQVLRDAYKQGWVRVAHPPGKGMLFVDARRQDLQRVAPILMRTINQPEIQKVVLNTADPGDQGWYEFDVPNQRRDVIAMLRGED